MKPSRSVLATFKLFASLLLGLILVSAAQAEDIVFPTSFIRTPPAPATPRINGPDVFGVSFGSPFLYTFPATGDRPLTFSIEGLPSGLSANATNGQITGYLKRKGEYNVAFHATIRRVA